MTQVGNGIWMNTSSRNNRREAEATQAKTARRRIFARNNSRKGATK